MKALNLNSSSTAMSGVSLNRLFSKRDKKAKQATAEGTTSTQQQQHHLHHYHHVSKEFSRLLHITEEKDSKKKADKDEDKKVKELLRRLQTTESATTTITQAHVEDALRLPSVEGSTEKAFELLVAVQDCLIGVLHAYNPDVKLVGAENRDNVTCYLDSLLFSMFARTDSFEAVLHTEYPDPERRRLVVLLRLWVNMLRTGKLITRDITQKLQESLRDCGWPEAALLRQQDVSEAFTFITGKLDLPLLTLKLDIYHTGKEDKDDHRMIKERLLDVAVPSPPEDGSVIRLEDCLESYFNNKVEVRRHLQRRNTLQESMRSRSMDKGQVLHVESVELRPGSPGSLSSSIFSHRPIGNSSMDPAEYKTHDDFQVGQAPRRRASTIRKEILMPAWQFFSLIPWYTHEHSGPSNDKQVAVHLETKRPVLGICLKRYTTSGTKTSTYVDIPLEIGLPHFISDDCGHGDNGYEPNFTNFKLSLMSVVCHRGRSLDAGHYISLVRGDGANLPPSSTTSSSSAPAPQPPQAPQAAQPTQMAQPAEARSSGETFEPEATLDSSHEPVPKPASVPAQDESQKIPASTPEEGSQESSPVAQGSPWLKFDDLAANRVSLVDIHQALKSDTEIPYLLFYQVQPIEDDPESERGDPPTYDEALIEASSSELSRVFTDSAVTDPSTASSVAEHTPSRDSFPPASDGTIATYEIHTENPSLLSVEKVGPSHAAAEPVNRSISDPELPLPSPVLVQLPKARHSVPKPRPKSMDLSHIALNPPKPPNLARASVDYPRGRNSLQSNRGSVIFTDPSTNGSHNSGSSVPITPGDEVEHKSGFLSASRRNSIGKGWLKTKSRPTSQIGTSQTGPTQVRENRLSLSMSRLRSAISKDKLEPSTTPTLLVENDVAVFPDGSPERRGSTSLHLDSGPDGKAQKKSGSIGRRKSSRHSYGASKGEKKRRKSMIGSMEVSVEPKEKGKGKKRAPERECIVM